MKVTRTLNPLHFEDLEPHRFEDLVRQLIYDFRAWSSIEALGRSGSDAGIDIRAAERVQPISEDVGDEGDEEDSDRLTRPAQEDRLWFIQCKREKEIGPSRVRAIVQSGLSPLDPKPYAYLLAAVSNFSKATRDAFREELVALGVEEYHIWGKAELEDLLYLPKNDHLLFAYFGISLQIRRRSKKALARSRIGLKRKLVNVLGGIRERSFHMVLIRDPNDEDYPHILDPARFLQSPMWRYWEFHSHQPPDHLSFVTARHYAHVDWKSGEWDAVERYDSAFRPFPEIHGLDRTLLDTGRIGGVLNAFMELSVPEDARAWLTEIRAIHYDRILAVDDLGDLYNEGPHLLVDFNERGHPFENRCTTFLEKDSRFPGFARRLPPDSAKRVKFFPSPIPDLTEDYRRQLEQRPRA